MGSPRPASIALSCQRFRDWPAPVGDESDPLRRHHDPLRGPRAIEALLFCKSYGGLVDALGTPQRKLAIPGRDPALTWAVSYGMRDARAGCFDAFTIVVVDGEERVVDYFCR